MERVSDESKVTKWVSGRTRPHIQHAAQSLAMAVSYSPRRGGAWGWLQGGGGASNPLALPPALPPSLPREVLRPEE